MTNHNDFDADALDDLLRADDGGRGDGRLRGMLLARTTRVLRGRRRARQVALAAALVGCYVAGLATVQMLTWAALPAGVNGTVVADRSVSTTAKRPEQDRHLAAEIIHSEAKIADNARPVQPRPSRYEALRQLGDQYLLERRDPEAAVRCYRLALRLATPEQMAVSKSEGTWLFQALKFDQEMEKNHANHDV